MRNITFEHLKDDTYYHCSSCSVMAADMVMQYFDPEYTWNQQEIALCRSCMALFRKQLKEEFKIMETRYAALKRSKL